MMWKLLPYYRRNSPTAKRRHWLAHQRHTRTIEPLEARHLLSVTFPGLIDIQAPGGKYTLVPLSASDSGNEAIHYTFSSDNSNVQLALVSPASKSLVLNVSGTDNTDNPFMGTLVLHLFEDLAPQTAAHIEQLAGTQFYDGLSFHRVIDGFMAQGGDNGMGGSGVHLSDEFNTALTFNSPGLLAMANSGGDTADAQFFITATDGASTTSPITLANMPQFLNFRYTIFGQLVSGFDTFEKIMTVQVTDNPQITNPNTMMPEQSKPVHSITINSAQVISDNQHAVLSVFVPSSFNGPAKITVDATNSDQDQVEQTFHVTGVADSVVDPPFLDPVSNITTAVGHSLNIGFTSTDLSGAGVRYAFAPLAQVQAQGTIDDESGVVTINPNPGATGTMPFIVGVRSAQADPNVFANYDVQRFTVTFVAPTLDPVANQTVAENANAKITLTSNDSLGNNVAYAIFDASTMAAPTNANVSIDQATGKVTITPNAGFTGTLHLLAAVRDVTSPDAFANYTTQSFTIGVVAPTLDPVANQTTVAGVSTSIILVGHSSLQNNLVYKIIDPGTTTAPTDVDVAIDQATGQVMLTPHAGVNGVVHLVAEVRDSTSPDLIENYTKQSFSLTVADLNAVSNQSTTVGTPIVLSLSTTPATQNLFFDIFATDSLTAPVNVQVSIDHSTGQVTLTAQAGFQDNIDLRAAVRMSSATNEAANYTFEPFTLTVNAGPSLGTVANQSTSRGTPVQITLAASNTTSDGTVFKIFAADSFNPPANVAIDINQTTHVVTLTPAAGFTGTINLRAGVRGGLAIDDPANYALQSFSLVVNPAPVMNAVGDKNVAIGSSIAFTLTSTDATANGVFYAVFDGASFSPPANVGVMLNHTTGDLQLTPPAGFTGAITLRAGVRDASAIDDPANYSLQTFTLNVLAPSLDAVPTQVTDVGVQKSFALNAADSVGHGLVYSIVDPSTLGAAARVSVQIDQTGHVTLTPAAGFGGFIQLRARVRFADSPDIATSYATRDFTLQVNSVLNLANIGNVQLPNDKSVLVPLTGTDSGGQATTYQFQSSDPTVQVALVSPGSRCLVLNVSGTDSQGSAFSGQLVLKLFEDLAPVTTARIIQLVQQGYFTNLLFHRVLNGFVAQTGQSNGGADTGVLLNDEFNTQLTFTSPGLLAMANGGRDTADSEFFITAENTAGGSPVTVADMPQDLNFRYTIFGQLVSGLDIFQKIMTAKVVFNPPFDETSQPSPSIHLDSATLITDTQNAVLRVFAPSGFTGNTTITVTATNPTGQTTQKTFGAAGIADPHTDDPPFLGSVSGQTTTAGVGVTFTLTSTDLSARGVVYSIFDATTHAPPTNITVSIDQATGQVTLTPAANLSGPINLLAAVRSSADQDIFDNYDTQAFTLTVNASPTSAAPTGLSLDSSSYTGLFDGNGYITTGTPKLTVSAAAGSTVQFKLNGKVIATATETSPGQYTATLPAGTLAVGQNNITAIVTGANGTSTDSTAFSVTYAPDYSSGVYVVPGAVGSTQVLATAWTVRLAKFNDEIGYFVVDSMDGSINGILPGQPGYAQAAIGSSSAHVIFASGQKAGASSPVTLFGGQMIVFYMIQNNTTANFLAKNPGNSLKGNSNSAAPLAFFSIPAANPDGMKHAQIVADPTTGRLQYSWEDLVSLGDSDFNDVVMTVRLSTEATPASTKVAATVRAPGAGSKTVTLTATLNAAKKKSPSGDVGVFFVDDPSGAIGSLKPGDPGYAAAALAAGNFSVLFSASDSGGANRQINVPAGKYLAFFYIAGGTADGFAASNPTNSTGGGPVALFSFDAANPDSGDHFRWTAPEGVAMDPAGTQLHIMDKVFGADKDFDDVIVDLNFAP